MKAVVWTAYGPPHVLQLQEVEKPVPKDNEVLIKVHAATVTAGDCEARRFEFPLLFRIPLRILLGLIKPNRLTLGQELAGEIEAVGRDVTRFNPGDNVFAATLLRLGAYAEYACLPETYPILLKPASIRFEEAATIPTGGINALHLVRKAGLQPGQSLILNGAGGSIGTYAIQIAKSLGAEVTAVDSAGKLDMLRTIGADHVIDYAQDDFTENGVTYDAIIDIVGKSSFSGSLRSLKPQGRYVLGNPSLPGMMRALWTSATTDKQVIFELARYQMEDFALLIEMIEAGKIKPVIDKRYPLEQVVEAHRYVEAGHKQGNLIISLKVPAPQPH